jgi:hypothetical protein
MIKPSTRFVLVCSTLLAIALMFVDWLRWRGLLLVIASAIGAWIGMKLVKASSLSCACAVGGGVLGALFGGILTGAGFTMKHQPAPLVFVGAVFGAAVWLCSTAVSERSPRLSPVRSRNYLTIAISSVLIGPIMAASLCLAVHYFSAHGFVGDDRTIFWEELAPCTIVGEIAGMLVAIPYFIASLIARNRRIK